MIHFFHGDKGGVGKSFAAQTFVDKLLVEGREIFVVETDTRNPDLARIFEGHCAIELVDLVGDGGWISLMDAAHNARQAGAECVVSLPAQFGREHESQGAATFVANAAELGGFRTWWLLSKVPDSIALLREFLASPLGQGGEKNVAVLNGFFGKQEDFSRWNESKTRGEFLAAGGSETFLPELYFKFVDTISGPFSAALDGLSFGEKASFSNWLQKAHRAFEVD